MSPDSFFKNFAILAGVGLVVCAVASPILLSQIEAVIFDLNMKKNQEQAERIATLASIDLENGVPHEQVLAKIQQMLESTPQSSEHFACIIEDENRVVAHPKPSNINKDVTGWTISNGGVVKTYTQSAGEGIPFGGIQQRLDGSRDITYQVPISSRPWSVCVHTKLDLISQRAYRLITQIGMVVVPGLLSIMLVGAFLMTRSTRRDDQLVS